MIFLSVFIKNILGVGKTTQTTIFELRQIQAEFFEEGEMPETETPLINRVKQTGFICERRGFGGYDCING